MTTTPPISPFDWLPRLWEVAADDPFTPLLPRDAPSLAAFYDTIRAFVAAHPRERKGRIDPAAIVRGEIVHMGEGSSIEAGAIIHDSCRLILGAGSVVRSGAVLRDEVVVGPRSMIGVHCEVVRSLVLGPESYLGHFVYLADSIVGREVNVAGNVMVANTSLHRRPIQIGSGEARVDSGRTHLGALIGDRVRFGASTTLCPGCIVAPDLALPPGVILLGTIDAARRERLMQEFFARWGG